jgi:hypothetical protein
LEEALVKLSLDEDLVASSGFTPYVTIFAAQALSALDDHAAAIELLINWLDDLDEIAAATARTRVVIDRPTAW